VIGRPHIVIGRRDAALPHMMARADFRENRWIAADLRLEGGSARAVTVQSSLKALLDQVFSEVGGGFDFTLTTQPIVDVIAAGNPAMMPGSVLPHEGDLWVQCLIVPASNTSKVLHDKRFVRKRLEAELRWILTPTDIEARGKISDKRELWIRHEIRTRPRPHPDRGSRRAAWQSAEGLSRPGADPCARRRGCRTTRSGAR
jgi:hypothetical protein